MIQIEDVSFSYNQGQSFRFSLKVSESEKLWIHGPSGAGKSTLFKLLLGFAQPAQGEISINGTKLSAHNAFALRQKMSLVPQQTFLGRGKISLIYKEVFNFKANRHLDFRQEEVEEYFEKFALGKNLLNHNFEELSGGEKQRVAIILALLLKREILLLDEAVSAIDQKQRKIILEHLAETDRTVLLIAHDRPQSEAFRELDFSQIKKN